LSSSRENASDCSRACSRSRCKVFIRPSYQNLSYLNMLGGARPVGPSGSEGSSDKLAACGWRGILTLVMGAVGLVLLAVGIVCLTVGCQASPGILGPTHRSH
jgi:hypothetical protein